MNIITLDDIDNISIDYKNRAYALNLDTIDLEFEYLGYLHQLKIKDWNSLSPKYIFMINSNIFINNKEQLMIDIPDATVYLNNNDLSNYLKTYINIRIVKFLDIKENQLIDYYSYFQFLNILKVSFYKIKFISFPILEYNLIKLLKSTNSKVEKFKSLVISLEDIDYFITNDYKDLYDLVILYTKRNDVKESNLVFIDYCKSRNINYLIFDSL